MGEALTSFLRVSWLTVEHKVCPQLSATKPTAAISMLILFNWDITLHIGYCDTYIGLWHYFSSPKFSHKCHFITVGQVLLYMCWVMPCDKV